MQIPVVRPVIGRDEVAAVSDVLMSGMLARGGKVAGLPGTIFFRAFLWNEAPFTGYGALEEAFF